MEKTIVVCNVCETIGKETLRYTVKQATRAVDVDLCADDAEALERLLPKAARKAPAKRSASPARRGRGVVTLAEIEALKGPAKS